MIGARLSWYMMCQTGRFVKLLMLLLYPIAFPLSKGLEFLLGPEKNLVYKRAGTACSVSSIELKEFVSRLGETHIGLSGGEVKVIRGVLELRGLRLLSPDMRVDKSLTAILTPLDDVFMLEYNSLLGARALDMVSIEPSSLN